MIGHDLVAICSTDSPGITLRVCTREQGERWVPGGRQGTFYLTPVPSCQCCGEPAWPNMRCTKHQGRTPCVVEGCRRTTGKVTAYYVCGEHWKAYVPPGSPERRAMNRLVRKAKKLGFTKSERWPPDLERRWWVLWHGTVRRVQKRSTEGRLDQREIERMFGWDEG